ncbi:IclR family transcriptional regulator [Streptomyces scabiei]|nr:IclR family transcriptional regulator [Streptomyces griseiscabiei]
MTATPSILSKAFAVLNSFDQNSRHMPLAEVARRSGLPKSTVHRVLGMLMQLGAVVREGDSYRMGLSMFQLGSCSPEVALRDVALPHMEALHRATGQTLHLAVLHGADVIYLEKLRSRSARPLPTVVGGSLPAHLTGVGKVLLAHAGGEQRDAVLGGSLQGRTSRSVIDPQVLRRELRQIEKDGFGRDRSEAIEGLSCLAAPLRLGGQVVAALSVAFPAASGGGEILISPLLETAAAVSRSLTRSSGRL